MTGGFFRKGKNYKGNDNWNTQGKDWLSIKDFIPQLLYIHYINGIY